MIPYIIMLLLCGLPLLFMELSMGQYTRRGPIGAIGKMCPLFQVWIFTVPHTGQLVLVSIIYNRSLFRATFIFIFITGSRSCYCCLNILVGNIL